MKYNFLFNYSIIHLLINNQAERAGFEPAVPLPVRQFSKLFLSASQASLRMECKDMQNNFISANDFVKLP